MIFKKSKSQNADGKYVVDKFLVKKLRDHDGPYPVMLRILAIKDQGY